MTRPTYHSVDVDGLDVFYRKAGNPAAPTLLLLHGFPTSSHMFRDLIPLLSDRLHLVAPDLPGFGRTTLPSRDKFAYTFENLAKVIGRFTEVVGLDRFALYIFDYGAPTGLRVALANPERITGIISQNGNAYEEGLSEGRNPIRRYWQDPTHTNRRALRELLTPESMRWQYTRGVPDPSLVAYDGSDLDSYFMTRVPMRLSSISSSITRATSIFTQISRLTSENSGRHFWQSGVGTTRSSCRPEPRLTNAICPRPMFNFSTPVTSLWKHMRMRSPRPSANF